MVKETRKILGTDDIAVTATCIRVPVMRAHAEAINLELERELSEDEARTILASAPGVSLSDDREANRCAQGCVRWRQPCDLSFHCSGLALCPRRACIMPDASTSAWAPGQPPQLRRLVE